MKYIRLAAKVAEKGRSSKNYHLGAVCIRVDGSIVAASNIKCQNREPTAHAESRALRKAGRGATLYIARVLANGDYAMARPCESCQQIIKKYRVRKVIYTVDNNTCVIWYPMKEKI